jgi:hypothetical protein
MMLVKSTQAMASILAAIDQKERLPIITEDFGDNADIILINMNGGNGAYYLNSRADAEGFTLHESVMFAAQAVRKRVQLQKSDVELFPFVDAENAGYIKDILMFCLEESSDSLEELDCEFFGAISGYIWRKQKLKSLPLIRQLAPCDASQIVEKTTIFVSNNL